MRVAVRKTRAAAIRVAVRAGIPLKIAAKVASQDVGYFHDYVRPLLRHPLVHWLGELDDDGKNRLLGDALACREWALNSFSAEKMTSDYEAAFQLVAPMSSGVRPAEEDETAAQGARR